MEPKNPLCHMPKMTGNPHSLIDTSPTPLKIVLILTNSADPEEIPPYAVFHKGLHCLPKVLFTVSRMKRVYIVYASNRPPDKSVNIFFIFISHPKHMLWVLKRTVTMRPKTAVKTDG